jgi:hypothetical protein
MGNVFFFGVTLLIQMKGVITYENTVY